MNKKIFGVGVGIVIFLAVVIALLYFYFSNFESFLSIQYGAPCDNQGEYMVQNGIRWFCNGQYWQRESAFDIRYCLVCLNHKTELSYYTRNTGEKIVKGCVNYHIAHWDDYVCPQDCSGMVCSGVSCVAPCKTRAVNDDIEKKSYYECRDANGNLFMKRQVWSVIDRQVDYGVIDKISLKYCPYGQDCKWDYPIGVRNKFSSPNAPDPIPTICFGCKKETRVTLDNGSTYECQGGGYWKLIGTQTTTTSTTSTSTSIITTTLEVVVTTPIVVDDGTPDAELALTMLLVIAILSAILIVIILKVY